MEVRYLPVYYPSEDEKADPSLYASNVQRRIGYALNVPLCAASYDDKVAYHEVCTFGELQM